MRPILLCLFLLAAVPASAGTSATAPPSAANVLRLHPGPWQLASAHLLPAGLRFEPETGEAASDLAGTLKSSAASLRARAEANVRVLADGSRHAVLNGALRSWTVATIDDQGRLVQDCVHTEAEARRRIGAATAAQKQVRK